MKWRLVASLCRCEQRSRSRSSGAGSKEGAPHSTTGTARSSSSPAPALIPDFFWKMSWQMSTLKSVMSGRPPGLRYGSWLLRFIFQNACVSRLYGSIRSPSSATLPWM